LIKCVLEKSAPNGSTKEERILSCMKLDPLQKRSFHDDITIMILYFDENRFNQVESYELQPEYFQPNPIHIKKCLSKASQVYANINERLL